MPQTPNTRLQLLLQAAGWNQTQLAAALRRVAAEHGQQLACDHSAVSRWLAGARPRPPASDFLVECLARRLGRPVTARDAGLTRAPDLMEGHQLSGEADPLRSLARLTAAELDPARRRLLGTAVFSLAALATPDLTQASPSPSVRQPAVAAPGRGSASAAHAAHMYTMTTVFADVAERHGGASIRAALAAYLAHDVTGWLHTPSPDTIHHTLLTGAARLTLLLGSACADSGDSAAAQRYHKTAARLAAQASDQATLAIALRTMATHAHDLGHYGPPVLNLAEQAAHQARGAPPAIRVYTQAHLAVLNAHHDKHAALTALNRAERLADQMDSTPGPFTAYPAGALHYQRAHALATLGDHTGALGALTLSLRLRTEGEQRARTLTHARLAETHLRLGHLETALTHWRTFLDNYPALHSAAAERRVAALRQHLRPHRRHSAAAALLAQAGALS
ncbi:hypothetical protein [Streptomyces parvus]|uniref:hypothetical protein n=1 Tax=Streptomyces parvus TaxID=66428 RepID=UPI00371CF3F3